MQREKEKKRKADEKRQRRLERKAGQPNEALAPDHEASKDLGIVETNDPSTITNEAGDDLSMTEE